MYTKRSSTFFSNHQHLQLHHCGSKFLYKYRVCLPHKSCHWHCYSVRGNDVCGGFFLVLIVSVFDSLSQTKKTRLKEFFKKATVTSYMLLHVTVYNINLTTCKRQWWECPIRSIVNQCVHLVTSYSPAKDICKKSDVTIWFNNLLSCMVIVLNCSEVRGFLKRFWLVFFLYITFGS